MDPQEVEQKARSMGWVGKEEFRSDPSMWVDAEEFVRRGEEILPIVKGQNKRLEADLGAANQRITQMEQTIRNNQEAMEALKQSAIENAKITAQAAYDRAKQEVKDAREAGDIDAEVEAQQRMTAAQADVSRANQPPANRPNQPAQQPIQIDPALKAWVESNPWYGVDQMKTARANAIGVMISTDPDTKHLRGEEFLREVSTRLDGAPPQSKVAGSGSPTGSGGSGSGGKGGKGYESMPADAREVCDRQGKKLVGEGRAYKSQAEWRKAYAEMYFQGE